MIYVRSQWVEVITAYSKRFSVYVMYSEDLKKLKYWWKLTQNRYISDHALYRLTHDDPCTLQARPSHNTLQPWTRFSLARKAKGRKNFYLPPVKVSRIPRLYKRPLAIKKEKKADLMAMMPYVPEEFSEFYHKINSNLSFPYSMLGF